MQKFFWYVTLEWYGKFLKYVHRVQILNVPYRTAILSYHCFAESSIWSKKCFIFQANVGQNEDFDAALAKALKLGATKVCTCEFVFNYES